MPILMSAAEPLLKMSDVPVRLCTTSSIRTTSIQIICTVIRHSHRTTHVYDLIIVIGFYLPLMRLQTVSCILWTDEAQFSRNGVVNRHNSHYWSQDNPHWLRHVADQVNWRVNVWCGIRNGSIIGPVFYDGVLGGIR